MPSCCPCCALSIHLTALFPGLDVLMEAIQTLFTKLCAHGWGGSIDGHLCSAETKLSPCMKVTPHSLQCPVPESLVMHSC